MPQPMPGYEAIDNGDGTASTFFDDGTAVTWTITTGELRPTNYQGGPKYGNEPGSYDWWPTYLRDPAKPESFAPQYGGAPIPAGPPSQYNFSVQRASAQPSPVQPAAPPSGDTQGSPWANPAARAAAAAGKNRSNSMGEEEGWVYDVLTDKTGQARNQLVRRHHVFTYNPQTKVVENEPVPSWDTSRAATYGRRDIDIPPFIKDRFGIG